MVIVEGPDRCGKSTLCKALRRLLPGWSYRHHTRPPVRPYSYFGWFLADATPRVVVDRLHWSELAYGLTYRGASDLTAHEWRLLELMALARDASVVLLTDDEASVRARWDSGEMFSVDGVRSLLEHYEELRSGTSPHRSHLLCRKFNLRDLVDERGRPTEWLEGLALELEARAAHAAKGFCTAAAVGASLYARVLVLGETPGDKDPRDLGPHVALGDGPACEWLWRALDAVGFQWWFGHYTNASEFRRGEDLGTYWTRLGVRRVVCLGYVATALAEDALRCPEFSGVEVVQVDHPGYAKRFRYHDFDGYCAELRDALGEELCG